VAGEDRPVVEERHHVGVLPHTAVTAPGHQPTEGAIRHRASLA
jgi:hypothetical protein